MLERLIQAFKPEQLSAIYSDGAQSPSARALRGAYYTPVPVAAQMTLDALAALLMRRNHLTESEALDVLAGKAPQGVAMPYIEDLSRLQWLDMASGTGVFALVHLTLMTLLGEDYGQGTRWAQQAALGMHVNDSHGEALETFKALCPYPVYTTALDALTGLRGDGRLRAVLEASGFDLIIGNPPYVGERGNKALFQAYRADPALAPFYAARMDLFYFFIHLGLQWLKPEGCLAQITTHYYATADGASRLRQQLREALSFAFVRFDRACEAFSDVKGLSFLSIVGTKRGASEPGTQEAQQTSVVLMESLTGSGQRQLLMQQELFDAHGQLILERPPISGALEHLKACAPQCLADVAQVNQGVVTGMDRWRSEQGSGPVFVYTEPELPAAIDARLFKPFIKNSMIKPYQLVAAPKLWLLYTDGIDPAEHPEVLEHLSPFKERLSARREVRSGVRAWYELQWGRTTEIFERPKLVSPQRAGRCSFALAEAPSYGSADVYYIGASQLSVQQLKGLAAYLNSPLVYSWLYQYGKRKGHLLELYATPLKRVPVPSLTDTQWTALAAHYDNLARIATQGGDLSAGEHRLHQALCDAIHLPRKAAEGLWEWYIVSIQT